MLNINPPAGGQNQKGVSLYLTLMIMTILLAIALGISSILVSQIKMIRGMGYSVIAFYAADTGIERELYEGNSPPFNYSGYLDLNGNGFQDNDDSSYNILVISAGDPDCPSPLATDHCIKSVGIYKETQRAIQVTR